MIIVKEECVQKKPEEMSLFMASRVKPFSEGVVRFLSAAGMFAIVVSSLSACQQIMRVDEQLVAEPDPVALRLANAVDRASAALQTLASVEQARNPSLSVQGIPYAPTELRRAVSVDWTGPIVPIAKRMADRAGYMFHVNGDEPPLPVVVTVRAYEKSVVEVLRDIGLQAGRRATIAVDPDQRVVELNYAPVDARQ